MFGNHNLRVIAVVALALAAVLATIGPTDALAAKDEPTAASCKAGCQDDYAYCTSHPEQCGHGSRICNSDELTVACTKKYGETCEQGCDERYADAPATPATPAQQCVAACEVDFNTCRDEGHSDRACEQKYGGNCRASC